MNNSAEPQYKSVILSAPVRAFGKIRKQNRLNSGVVIVRISFLCFLAYPVLIASRIRDEEKLLEAELPGYKAYQKKVKYRLIPGIW